MLPDNRASLVPVISEFLSPDDLRDPKYPLLDYERGGVAINNPTLGLNYQDWSISYNTPLVQVSSQLDPTPQTLFSQENIVRLALAFDRNMRPTVAYELVNGETYLWWFDPVPGVQTQVFTFISGAVNSCLALDDKRDSQSLTSDVIMAYQKEDGGLYYRQQRDRYTIERLLAADTQGQLLYRIGMGKNNRLIFQFRPNTPL